MKRIIAFFIILVLSSCGGADPSDNNDNLSKELENDGVKKVLSMEEFEKVFLEPKKYKGSRVDFYGIVFVEPARDRDGTYLQVFVNNNEAYNAIIMVNNPDLNVDEEDIIHVKGTIQDSIKGENLFGGFITAPLIVADTIEKTDYQTAIAPAKETIEVDEEQSQQGYILYVDKVELADSETRVYVKVENKSNDKIYFYTFNTKIIASGKQYEEVYNYEANYPEVQSEILPGVNSEGIIVFPKLPNDVNEFQIYFEGFSDDWEIDFKPFVYRIKKDRN